MEPEHADSRFDDRPPQFLADLGAFLIRQANVAAALAWEGIEIRFEANPETAGGEFALRLVARQRAGGKLICDRVFTDPELSSPASLPRIVEDWVRDLPLGRR
jgi:hypothetical protein